MKLFLTHIMAVSLLIQSIAFSFSFNNAIAMSEHVPIQESETSFDIADLTDDELLFIQFARQREREHDLCKDAGGSKGYSLELIENLDSIDETDKKINCKEVAEFMYTMNQGNLGNDDRAFSCLTQAWDYETKLDFFGSLENVAISAEKHFNCPGKDISAGMSTGTNNADSCLKDAVCSAYQEVPGALKLITSPVLAATGYCKGFKPSTDSGCISNMLWGVWKSLIGNVEGLWALGGMAIDGAKWVGKKLCFWCADEVQAVEDANELKLHAVNQATDGWFSKFVDHPIDTTLGMFSNFFSGMKNYIAESAQSNFMCLNYNGARDFSAMGGDINKAFTGDESGQAKCSGKDRYVNWECSTCAQKLNMFCGIGGFLGGEVVASFFMGKGFSYAGRVISKAGQISKGSRLGQLVASLGKSQKTQILKEFGIKSLEKVKIIASNTKYTILESGGKWMVKIGNTLVPLGSKRKAALMALLNGAKGTGKLSKAFASGLYKYSGVKAYINLLEDSFVLGMQGRAGLKAVRAAREIGKLESKVQRMRVSAQSDQGRLAIVAKQESAIRNLKEYKKLMEDARKVKGITQEKLLAQANIKRQQYEELMRSVVSKTKDINKVEKTLMANNPNVTREVIANSKLDDIARTQQIQKEFSHLDDTQVIAVMKAHNDVPCVVGNCSKTQIKEKIRIMREAQVPRETYQAALKKGLAGSSPTPTPKLFFGEIPKKINHYDIKRVKITKPSDPQWAKSLESIGETEDLISITARKTLKDGTVEEITTYGRYKGTDGQNIVLENGQGTYAINPKDSKMEVTGINRVLGGDSSNDVILFESNANNSMRRLEGKQVKMEVKDIEDGDLFDLTGEVVLKDGKYQLKSPNKYNGEAWIYSKLDSYEIQKIESSFQKSGSWSGKQHTRLIPDEVQPGVPIELNYKKPATRYGSDKTDEVLNATFISRDSDSIIIRTKEGKIQYIKFEDVNDLKVPKDGSTLEFNGGLLQ